jgi:hypothetical protein
MNTIKADKVKMVKSDTAASKFLKDGWELVNVFSHGNVIAYILVKNYENDRNDLKKEDK